MKEDAYENALREAGEAYGKDADIYCRALSAWVALNSKGFRHIFCNGSGTRRTHKDIVRRLSSIPSAIHAIARAQSIAHYRISGSSQYWKILEKSIGVGEVSVILRRDGKGKICFYSVWPRTAK